MFDEFFKLTRNRPKIIEKIQDAYKLQLEKVYLCTGSNGFVPTFDPSGEIYGQGPQYGCIRPMKSISHRFLILDRGNRDAEDEDFQVRLIVQTPARLLSGFAMIIVRIRLFKSSLKLI